MKFIHILFAIALLTASCDTVLVFNLGGTLHLAQVILVVVILASVGRMIQSNTVLWPRGGMGMLIWCVLQGFMITRSSAPFSVDLQVYVLLLFTIGSVLAVLQLYGRSSRVESLMKVYLSSYVLIAAFGLFQFVTPGLHLGEYLVGQWIVHGLIPRIAGFNYEPSYFATYLIMGWIMLIDLQVTKAKITSARRWKWFTILVSVVFFLSTSKTAWLFMIVEGFARLVPVLLRLLRVEWSRLRQGDLWVPLPKPRVLVSIALVAVLLVGLAGAVSRVVDLNIFLAGSGLNNTAAHSLNDRTLGLDNTLQVWHEHPWFGLGDTGATARKAEIEGGTVNNLLDWKTHWAFPVPLEVLAASGVIGILPFLWFFGTITLGETRLMRQNWDDDRARWLHALIRALAYEWLCLLSDQNLLRAYLWFHVTMVVVVGYNLRFVRDEQFGQIEQTGQTGDQPAEAMVPA